MNEQNESERAAPPTIAPLTSMDVASGFVLAAYLITQFLRGRWDTVTLPAASILTILSGPGNFLINRLHSAPSGFLAVVGSFVLFALGTAAALTTHRWHKTSIERETL